MYIPIHFYFQGDIDSKMMSALLNGVSRAFPFMKGECSVVNEHINTVYKVVHLSRANVAIHALSLLYLVVGETLTDRSVFNISLGLFFRWIQVGLSTC